MRKSASQEAPQSSQSSIDPESDRHPTLKSVLRALQDSDLPVEGPVERVELFLHASGDCTYRVWPPRAEEPEGGYLGPEVFKGGS